MTTPDHATHDASVRAAAEAPGAPAREDHIVQALQDVLTVQVLDALTTGVVAPGTVAALSAHLDAEPAEVEERLRRLEGWNLVEVATTGPSGQVYRSTRDALISDEDWAKLSPAQRRLLTIVTLDSQLDHVWAAVDRGGFDHPSTHISWVPSDLDREGHQEMVRLGAETLERIRDIQAAVVDRRANGTSDGAAIKSDFMLLHFDQGEDIAELAPSEEELRDELYCVLDELAEEAPEAWPNWRGLAARGRDLTRIARRLGTMTRRVA